MYLFPVSLCSSGVGAVAAALVGVAAGSSAAVPGSVGVIAGCGLDLLCVVAFGVGSGAVVGVMSLCPRRGLVCVVAAFAAAAVAVVAAVAAVAAAASAMPLTAAAAAAAVFVSAVVVAVGVAVAVAVVQFAIAAAAAAAAALGGSPVPPISLSSHPLSAFPLLLPPVSPSCGWRMSGAPNGVPGAGS